MRVPCRFKVSICVFGLIYAVVAEQERDNPFSSVVKKTLISTARMCMSHVHATEADLEHLRKDPPYPEKAACIIKCLLEKEQFVPMDKFIYTEQAASGGFRRLYSYVDSNYVNIPSGVPQGSHLGTLLYIAYLSTLVGIVRHNKYSKMGFMAVVTPLVLRNKKKMEHMKSVSESCDKEINHHEVSPCQLGNEITACIFKYAPELHLKA